MATFRILKSGRYQTFITGASNWHLAYNANSEPDMLLPTKKGFWAPIGTQPCVFTYDHETFVFNGCVEVVPCPS